MADYFDELIGVTGNPYASKVSDGMLGSVNEHIDTGSYILNALLSGSIYKGLPSNKITAFAGESATGKTFFLLGLVKQFLADNTDGGVLYFESESALTPEMIEERNIDTKRFIQLPVATIQEFAQQATRVVDKHIESSGAPLLLCLDSLGMLSTEKEVGDTTEGANKVDMTKARIVKGTFRVLTLKLAKAGIPLIVTNHTYKQVGTMFPQDVMGGGSGLQYAASTIIFLSKRKEKVGTDVIGNIIHCKNFKSRLTKENKMVDVLLTYDEGLSRYYGLLELAEKYGIINKVSTRYEMPDGTKIFGKQILSDPEKYFTADIMEKLEEAADKEFLYGKGSDAELSTNESAEEKTEG
jgi:RecA/RadA recombinase|tara:strand:+ start:171 stop:1229 length:1059 start_codon:yes stop_codon:yes gene_type:complete